MVFNSEAYNSEAIAAAAAIAKSREWVSAIDRTGLGRYAVDAECLAAAHAYISTIANKNSVYGETMNIMAATVMKSRFRGDFSKFKESAPFSVEVMFWWSKHERSNKAQMNYINKFRNGGRGVATKEVMRKMKILISNPERRDYYEAGIWNDVEIDKARAAGVDPDLLLTMLHLD